MSIFKTAKILFFFIPKDIQHCIHKIIFNPRNKTDEKKKWFDQNGMKLNYLLNDLNLEWKLLCAVNRMGYAKCVFPKNY